MEKTKFPAGSLFEVTLSTSSYVPRSESVLKDRRSSEWKTSTLFHIGMIVIATGRSYVDSNQRTFIEVIAPCTTKSFVDAKRIERVC